MKTAYVYAIKVAGVVRYIGKGSGIFAKRANEHLRIAKRLAIRRLNGERIWAANLYNRLSKAWKEGKQINIVILARDLDDDAAFEMEREEIASKAQQLWNLDGGGLGGRKISDEHRKILSAAAKRRAQRPGEREWRVEMGKKNSKTLHLAHQAWLKTGEARQLLSKKAKARWRDPECAARMKAGLEYGRRPEAYTAERAAKRWASVDAGRRHSIAMKKNWELRRADGVK